MKRSLNPNKCKIHRIYTVEGAALLYGIHKNTVRNWIKKGLPVCGDKRPILILGSELKLFLQKLRDKRKHKCKPSELYCLRCRSPRVPVINSVEFETESLTQGRVKARCSRCNTQMNKYFKLSDLKAIKGNLT